jgi:DNA-binding IclR family transcriptional regulator
MPRFYFDVREGRRFTRDEEGLEFPDLAAAERDAACAAAEIACDALPSGEIGEISVAIRDKNQQPVMTLTVSMVRERVAPDRTSRLSASAGRRAKPRAR